MTQIERWDGAQPEPDCERCDGPMACIQERRTVAEEEEVQRMADAYAKAEADTTPAQRLLEQLAMLAEEEKGLAMDTLCTIVHRSGLVEGQIYASLDAAGEEITDLWYWDESAHDLRRYAHLTEVMAVHFPDGTTLARHSDGTWFRGDHSPT